MKEDRTRINTHVVCKYRREFKLNRWYVSYPKIKGISSGKWDTLAYEVFITRILLNIL